MMGFVGSTCFVHPDFNNINQNNNIMEDFLKEWENIELYKIFEIEVKDLRTNKKDIIIFNISIDGTNFRAERIGLNQQEEESKKISFSSIEIDTDFSIDENLQALFDECQTAILISDFFKLI